MYYSLFSSRRLCLKEQAEGDSCYESGLRVLDYEVKWRVDTVNSTSVLNANLAGAMALSTDEYDSKRQFLVTDVFPFKLSPHSQRV